MTFNSHGDVRINYGKLSTECVTWRSRSYTYPGTVTHYTAVTISDLILLIGVGFAEQLRGRLQYPDL